MFKATHRIVELHDTDGHKSRRLEGYLVELVEPESMKDNPHCPGFVTCDVMTEGAVPFHLYAAKLEKVGATESA